MKLIVGLPFDCEGHTAEYLDNLTDEEKYDYAFEHGETQLFTSTQAFLTAINRDWADVENLMWYEIEINTNVMNTEWNNGNENHNWVIIQDNGEPLRFDDGELVIYGGVEDYEIHLIEGDTAITLGEYAKQLGVNWRTLIS